MKKNYTLHRRLKTEQGDWNNWLSLPRINLWLILKMVFNSETPGHLLLDFLRFSSKSTTIFSLKFLLRWETAQGDRRAWQEAPRTKSSTTNYQVLHCGQIPKKWFLTLSVSLAWLPGLRNAGRLWSGQPLPGALDEGMYPRTRDCCLWGQEMRGEHLMAQRG